MLEKLFSSYRQLMCGVDQIKLVAEVLASVDKITDASIPTGNYSDSKIDEAGAFGGSVD